MSGLVVLQTSLGLARLGMKPRLCRSSWRVLPPLTRSFFLLLLVWTEDSVSFPFGIHGSGKVFDCSLCGTMATFFLFGGPSIFQVFPLNLAPFCKLFAGLSSTHKSVISLPFYLSLSLSLFSSLCPFLHLSFYLDLCGRSDRKYLLFLPMLSDYNESPENFRWCLI